MMEKKERKGNRFLVAAVIVLLITVGVLLWLLLRPMPKPDRIPTGNVEYFDIRIGVICRNVDGSSCFDDDDDLSRISRQAGEKPTAAKRRR